MVQLTPARIFMLTTLAITLLLSIISMAGVFQIILITSSLRTSQAFAVIAFLFILGAIVIYILLFFTCSNNVKLLMIIVVVLAGLCLISEAIALGLWRPTALIASEWLMATIWMAVPVIVGGLLNLFMDDEGF